MARSVGISKITRTIFHVSIMKAGSGGWRRTLHEEQAQAHVVVLRTVKLEGGINQRQDQQEELEVGYWCSSWWVPDPRTGIYYPKGHERVMHDIPNGAASLRCQTHWFRCIDGVDRRPLDDQY